MANIRPRERAAIIQSLRAGVTQYLKSDPRIRTFRLGTFGEGENGVTIAEIK